MSETRLLNTDRRRFLALLTQSLPVLDVDWEPTPWPTDELLKIRIAIGAPLSHLGSTFWQDIDASIATSTYAHLVSDLVECSHVAYWLWSESGISSEQQRWIYLKTQALSYRLMALTPTSDEHILLRAGLLRWLQCITDCVGTRLCSLVTLDRLEAALKEMNGISLKASPGLWLWCSSLGAMIALSTTPSLKTAGQDAYGRRAAYFVDQTRLAMSELSLDSQDLEGYLSTSLYLPDRQQEGFTRLRRALSSDNRT